MTEIDNLMGRIDAEFSSVDAKIKKQQAEQLQDYRERQRRLEQFGRVLDELRDIWRPRLEALAGRFGERVKVTPRLTPSRREAVLQLRSELANVSLTFSVYTDRDVRNLTLASDLRIVPILMKFDSHSEIEFPLDRVDRPALGRWMDDCIINCVRTYLALHENEHYMRQEMVADPITQVRFLKQAAGATLDYEGQKYYFVDEESRGEFARQKGISA
jgi:YHS domain-containing protein